MICTYNGSSRLKATLTALARINRKNIPNVELVLVDNASTDDTCNKALSLWEELGSPYGIKLLSETKPGKIHAQNLGLKHVKTNYVLICDDDNELFPDYLEIGYELLNSNPSIGALGGQGMVKSTVPIPEWFSEMAYNFACAPQAEKTGDVRPTRNVIYGAGMFMAMDAYHQTQKFGFEYLLPSRTGNGVVTGAEDGELCWWLRFCGYEIWYAEELKFYHHISPSRLTNEYREQLKSMFHVGFPSGKLYLRIDSGELVKPISFFWLKEWMYTFLYLLKIPLMPASLRKLERKRCLAQMQYFVKERSRYDAKFHHLLKIYKELHGAK